MCKKVAVIQTSLVSTSDIKNLFKEIIPEVQIINIIDDSLISEVMDNGGLTNNVTRRICTYAREAEAIGADLILNQCSSVGEAVDVARKVINVPYLKIDEPMAQKAVRIGDTVSVIATVQTTLGPTIRLIEREALKINKKILIRKCLVEGAFEVLFKEGNQEKHNKMALEKIRQESEKADVIVLAQGSMVCLLPYLNDIRVPVLTSLRSGIERVKEVLYK